jgi:hypothetical protein
MKKIHRSKLKEDTDYLVFTGYGWSPSGFDIGNYELSGCLTSQTNGEDLLSIKNSDTVIIYELPKMEI